MSTDTCGWVGSDPDRFKKKTMRLINSGKLHLSNKSTNQSWKKEYHVPEVGEKTALLTIASVMSLWRNSGEQGSSCKVPRVLEVPSKDSAIQKSTELWQTKNTTATTSGTKALNFQTQQENRSKVNSCNPTRKTNINQLNTGKPPVNSTNSERLSGLETAKDFGIHHQNLFFTILKDAITTKASAGQLYQNYENRSLERLGRSETVQASTNQKRKESKSLQVQANDLEAKTFENSGITVLSVLPVLSCVLQVNQFSDVLKSQIHAIKNFLSYAITVRLIVLGTILQQCELLARQGHFKVKVNQADIIREKSDKIANIKQTSVSGATPNVSLSMANEVNQIDGDFDQWEDMMEEDDFRGGEDRRGEEARVPDFGNIIDGGDDEAGFDDDYAFNRLMAGNNRMGNRLVQGVFQDEAVQAVPEAEASLTNQQIGDDFLNRAICDHDLIEALLPPLNDPEDEQRLAAIPLPPLDEDIQFLMDIERDPQWLQQQLDLILDPAFPPNAA